MTLSELQDWHRRRVGWNGTDPDPFPATLDGARASFPEGVVPWWIVVTDEWHAPNGNGFVTVKSCGSTWDSMIRDWYALSKLVWEARNADR
jgi:hypothetical protein